MSNKSEHLNMIQGVITRMASNSLQIKCWSIAITAAVIALSNNWIMAVCVAPLILFWYLDARYLALERSYRVLYDDVRVKDESEIDYSMRAEKTPIKSTLFSWSVILFYITLIAIVICASVFLLVK